MRRTAMAVLLILLMGLVCACANEAPVADPEFYNFADENPPASADAVSNGMEGIVEGDILAPLQYVRAQQMSEEGNIADYPYIVDERCEDINTAIQTKIRKLTEAENVPTSTFCSITYNDCGVFSVLIRVRDLRSNDTLALEPMTFDATCGALCSLGSLFDAENERWRGLIPDIVALQAEKTDITLLCDIMPVTDEQAYYINDGYLVILYRPYEIATYAAGWPAFFIPIGQLSDFFAADSPIQRLLAEPVEQKETAAITPMPTAFLDAEVLEEKEKAMAAGEANDTKEGEGQ